MIAHKKKADKLEDFHSMITKDQHNEHMQIIKHVTNGHDHTKKQTKQSLMIITIRIAKKKKRW